MSRGCLGTTGRDGGDHGQHGVGSQSCGPGPLPRYRLRAEPAEFSFVFSPAR
ncbi:hypothetical protein ACH4UM_07840 [Streptomyces sp. NPDC020801]|uniref:hypothetical protein n=1 Tax=unclassified Streptomyces TaxID=2593676 RepID=UPI00378CB36B